MRRSRQQVTQLKASEREFTLAIVESKMLFKAIETTKDAICIVSLEGKIIYANSAMDELFGYKKGELIEKYPSILNAGSKPKAVTIEINKAVMKEGYWEGEIHNKMKDGTEFISYARISVLRDQDDKPMNFISTQFDISEQKKVKKELLQSEEKYRLLAENAMDGIYIISIEAGFEYVNPAFERITGYKSEEVYNKNFSFFALVHPNDKELVQKRRKARGKDKKLPPIYEFRIITKEDEVKFIEVNTVPLPAEKGRILGILRDITKRKKTEDELSKAKERFKGIYNSSKDAIAYTDLEGNILDINSSFCSLTGYSRTEILNRMKYQDLTPEKYHNFEAEIAERILRTGKSEEYEKEYIRKDGSLVPILLTPFIVRGDDNCPIGMAAIIRDISERKQVEKELTERKEELEIKSSNLEELNIALKVLLKKREEDKSGLEESILYNVEELIVPYLEKLKKNGLNKKHRVYIEIMEKNINEIISSFAHRISIKYRNFTITEIRIADLIRHGKRNKEISDILNVSPRTIAFHRENIRKKLGLKNSKINLASYLSSQF